MKGAKSRGKSRKILLEKLIILDPKVMHQYYSRSAPRFFLKNLCYKMGQEVYKNYVSGFSEKLG